MEQSVSKYASQLGKPCRWCKTRHECINVLMCCSGAPQKYLHFRSPLYPSTVPSVFEAFVSVALVQQPGRWADWDDDLLPPVLACMLQLYDLHLARSTHMLYPLQQYCAAKNHNFYLLNTLLHTTDLNSCNNKQQMYCLQIIRLHHWHHLGPTFGYLIHSCKISLGLFSTSCHKWYTIICCEWLCH